MPFVKGQSGNPNGRPKSTITVELRKLALEPLPDGVTRAQALAQAMWKQALSGDTFSQKYVTDRLDGSPMQSVELTGEDGGPVESLVKVELVKPSNS